MREFIQVDEYKINILKLIAFIYANTSTLKNTRKKIIYNRNKKIQDLPWNKLEPHKENKSTSSTQRKF